MEPEDLINADSDLRLISLKLDTFNDMVTDQDIEYLYKASKPEGHPIDDMPEEVMKTLWELSLVEIEDDKIFFKADKLVIRND